MEVECLPGSRMYLGTQSSTKVYKGNGKGGCVQETFGTVHANAMAVVCPDPVVPFAGSTLPAEPDLGSASGCGSDPVRLAAARPFGQGRGVRLQPAAFGNPHYAAGRRFRCFRNGSTWRRGSRIPIAAVASAHSDPCCACILSVRARSGWRKRWSPGSWA